MVALVNSSNPVCVHAGLQCLQLCADALCSCDLSPLSALTDLRALALTSHNDKQRCAVPPSVLGAHGVLSTSWCGEGQHAPAPMTAALRCAALCGECTCRGPHTPAEMASCTICVSANATRGSEGLSAWHPSPARDCRSKTLMGRGRAGLTRLRELALRATSLDTVQDGVSRLQALRTCEIVGARGLVIEPGFGTLRNLRELEVRRLRSGFGFWVAGHRARLWHPVQPARAGGAPAQLPVLAPESV